MKICLCRSRPQVGEEGQPSFAVQGHDVSVLRSKIPGKQGSFVSLKFRRGEDAYFDVDLMRGSPEFIEAPPPNLVSLHPPRPLIPSPFPLQHKSSSPVARPTARIGGLPGDPRSQQSGRGGRSRCGARADEDRDVQAGAAARLRRGPAPRHGPASPGPRGEGWPWARGRIAVARAAAAAGRLARAGPARPAFGGERTGVQRSDWGAGKPTAAAVLTIWGLQAKGSSCLMAEVSVCGPPLSPLETGLPFAG